MKRLLIFALLLKPALAAVTVSATLPPYGFTVETGAVRYPVVQVTGGATNLVNWTASGATVSCSSNCPGTTAVTITASGGTGSTTGSYGSIAYSSTSVATATATSVDDPTKSVTFTFNVIDTTTNAQVVVVPAYNQCFQGQTKTLQSYVVGYINQNVTWSITTTPGGGNGTLSDTSNRDTVFSCGTVAGRYVFTATSAANGAISGTAIVYVGTTALPRSVSPNKTETTACFVDPAMTGTDYEVGPTQAVTDLSTINLQASSNAGVTIRIFNDDTTGSNPTTYHNAVLLTQSATASQPLWICGVPDSLGNLPVLDGNNAIENAAGAGKFVDGEGGFKLSTSSGAFGQGYNLGSIGPDYVNFSGIRIQNFEPPNVFIPPETITSIVRSSNLASITFNQPWTCNGATVNILGVTNDPTLNVSNTVISSTGTPNVCTYPSTGSNLTATGTPTITVQYGAGAGVWARSGQFVHLEGLDLASNDWGVLLNNNTTSTGRTFARYEQLMGSHITNFGANGQFGFHGAYLQGFDPLVEGNLFENPAAGMQGDFMKVRGGDGIIRYNTFIGEVGDHIDEINAEIDSWQFADIASMLGQPGVTSCPTATCYGTTTNNITFPQITENMESLAKHYVYGNIMSNYSGNRGQAYLQGGSFSAVQECLNDQGAWCTEGVDFQGTIYFFHNTADQAGAYYYPEQSGVISTANYNGGGFVAAAQNVQPAVFLQNNTWWNDTSTNGACYPANPICFPFNISLDTTFLGTFVTNLAASGAVTYSGTITGGTTIGWGGYNNAFSFTNSQPMQTHMSGLTSGNFLTASSMPYNSVTFAPVTSSPLISAGSAITLTEIAHMPVRYQPLITGYMSARTDVGSSTPTIGAVQTGSQPTLSSVAILPNNPTYPLSTIGTQTGYTLPATYSNGSVIFGEYRSQPWGSTGAGIACFGANNPVCNIEAAGSGTITTTYQGTNASTNYLVGGTPVQTTGDVGFTGKVNF